MNIVKLRGELGDRYISPPPSLDQQNLALVLLDSGELHVKTPRDEHRVSGRGWLLLPVGKAFKARASSGALGYVLIVSGLTLTSALQGSTEAVSIARWVKRRSFFDLSEAASLQSQLRFYFESLQRELEVEAIGSTALCRAWLLCLLVIVWRQFRHYAGESDDEMVDDERSQFWALVEVNFRQRWSVERYAKELLVTPDHLHDMCRRTLQKPPSRLIQERTLNEAITFLVRSDDSMQQISDTLGFRSPAYFSSYFKRAMGVSPRAYRVARAADDTVDDASLSFSDWP